MTGGSHCHILLHRPATSLKSRKDRLQLALSKQDLRQEQLNTTHLKGRAPDRQRQRTTTFGRGSSREDPAKTLAILVNHPIILVRRHPWETKDMFTMPTVLNPCLHTPPPLSRTAALTHIRRRTMS